MRGAITSDDETEAGRKQLIIQLTEATIKCVENGDYEAYSRLCDPQMTSIEPETFGNVIEGMEFHRFYFENQNHRNKSATKSIMLKPHVNLLGSDSAVICYTRLEQIHEEGTGAFNTVESVETRVWHKRDGQWQLLHFHKSNTGSNAN